MTFYNLTPISTQSPFKYYEDLVKAKRSTKAMLYGDDKNKSNCYYKVERRYREFEKFAMSLSIITESHIFDLNEKYALLDTYNVKTKVLEKMKKEIIDIQNIHYKNKCIYCGIGDVYTMDHYYPKEKYFEFSTHCLNLIPCCSHCNGKKGMKFLNQAGEREVYNPYFDKVNTQQIIFCEFNFRDNKIIIDINKCPTINNPLVINHLKTLDIIERYITEVPRKLSSIIFDIITNYEENQVTKEGAKRVLLRKLTESEHVKGINSLDAIVYREYIKHDVLFDLTYLKKIYTQLQS